MELHEYPRPANDTGIGIHWTVGFATAVGLSRIREHWLPTLKSMGVKWVKIFNHDGALDFCELLLSEGIMPVVRIYRPSPNPGRLGVKELVHLDALIRLGVRYFEFNNEPDVDAEWKGGRVPVNGLDLTVESTIASMEVILERGGMPALPAVANGSRWDLTGKIVAAGRKDLFDGPVWQAVHNYSRNRPLDYPYDIGSQEGAPYTERFYRVVAAEEWGEDAWRGRTLTDVNRLRFDRRSPGATIMDDHACWLAYEYFDGLNRKHLGRSLPILATECGYLVGEDVDPRYPATTPDLHMAQTLETCRVMMGASQRFKAAPDYFFCTAFWLLANVELGSTSSWWESNAWFSPRWPEGALPIVRALQNEPKVARLSSEPEMGRRVTLRGTIADAPAAGTVTLEQSGATVAKTELAAGSSFAFADLAPGSYVLRLQGAALAQRIDLTPDQREVVVNLAVGSSGESVSRSVIAGKVRGGAGVMVVLVRQADGEEWVTLARDDGSFRFVNLPAGVYSARLDPPGSTAPAITLDGRGQVDIDLAVSGWGYVVRTVEDSQKVGAVVITVPGRRGLRVQLHTAEWSSDVAVTGTAPAYGEFAAYFAPLDSDHYIVAVEGALNADGQPVTLEARVHVDRHTVPIVEFTHTAVQVAPPAQQSEINGRIIGQLRAGQPFQVLLVDRQAQRVQMSADEGGAFRFTGLAAGPYTVAVAGFESATACEIALDGRNQVEVELSLPYEPARGVRPGPADGVITGIVPDAPARRVRLLDAMGNEQVQATDAEGRFRFAQLPAGQYSLLIDGGFVQSDLQIDGADGWEIVFAPVIAVWETETAVAGSMPGFSSLRVEVEGIPHVPVRVWQGEEAGMVAATGSTPGLGADLVEFKPLGPGLYLIEPDGIGVWTSVELTGLEVVWVTFRRKLESIGRNEVRPLRVDSREQAALHEPRGPYLFIAGPPGNADDLLAVLDYVAERRPAFGADVDTASAASLVAMLGPVGAELSDAELRLLLRGVRVERVRGPWREFLLKLGS